VLLDALEPVVAGWASVPPALGRRADSIELLLTPVAPQLGPCDDRQYGPEELLRAAVDLIRFLVPEPALLVFEDLHGAAAESISLFGRLATVPELNALLVGTYRPEDLGLDQDSVDPRVQHPGQVGHDLARRGGGVGRARGSGRPVYLRPTAVQSLFARSGIAA
jgi:hypothetical protein